MLVELVHSEHKDHVITYTTSTYLNYLTAYITDMSFGVTLFNMKSCQQDSRKGHEIRGARD
jgi:hypothetical protein